MEARQLESADVDTQVLGGLATSTALNLLVLLGFAERVAPARAT